MELKKTRSDIIIYSLLLIVCAVMFFWLTAEEVPLRANAADSSFTPRTFPNLLTIGIALASAIGLISSCIKYAKLMRTETKDTTEKKPVKKTAHEWLILFAPYITFVILVVYGILFEKLGYIVSTLLLVPALTFLFGSRKWQHIAIVYAFAALMFVLFKFVLLVPLR